MRRLLELITGLGALRLLGLAVAAWLGGAPTTSLMPAADGAITDLAIQFHRVEQDRFLPVYEDLLSALAPGTRVHVVVADDEDESRFRAAVATWNTDVSLEFARTDAPITSWMRDRLAVLPTAEDTVLLAPAAPMTGPEARVHDWLVPWTLGAHLGDAARVQQARYRFDGGDLIADETRVYVASPLFARNPDLPAASLVAMLEEDLGREVLVLDRAPNHHIGMFVTPLGEGRVAVGDPTLARDLLGDADTAGLVVGGRPVGRAPTELLASLDHIADQLEDVGLDVVRLPLLPTDQQWAWLSYNNVLAETRDDGLHVYMPVYGVDALDAAATAIWRTEGATVHAIEVGKLFRLGGSVRCLTAPIARR
ncbi:MAG: hypothetical protein EP330_29170 [Deltaproteobacteria bacterium]|nr:MAG: hypothetical protein EP330_29170 [Deltaproteobacteria bacterium]